MGEIKWYETNMTSNTAPVPLVASASSAYSNTYAAWKAFNGTSSSTTDCWWGTSSDAWIQIQYPSQIRMVSVRVSSRYGSDTQHPVDFKILGSRDGVDFVELLSVTNQTTWGGAGLSETRQFDFENENSYMYYRLQCVTPKTNNLVMIGDIIYGEWEADKKLILNNPQTNQYYSLADRTLITLPNASNALIIAHGLTAGVEVKLDEDFNKIKTVSSDGTFTEEDVSPFSVYDYISKNPQAIVYTESKEDIILSIMTAPYDLYDEFGDEMEVLYYTDDTTITEADLILEANWSPIDELIGDFEVVTWTDEPQETAQRVLEMTAIPKPQFIKSVEAKRLANGIIDLSVIDKTYGYKNNTRFLITDTYGINWYVWNNEQNRFVTINTTNDDLLDVGMTADELNSLTPAQWSLWTSKTINIGIYMYDSPRDNITSLVEDISYQENVYRYTPELSNLLFYILNTTAKINVQLDGNVLRGEVSDDDLTRVQYRVLLNGHPYFPEDGEFTPLGAPPVNIDLVISGRDVKIDENNVLKVEFKDYFGTVDYWQTNFTGMYAGLIFKDIYGDYYSNDVGEVLKYLDFGNIIAGQTTIEHEVLLKNQYGYDVSNLVLRADSSEFPSGMEAQFSKTQAPFVSEPELTFANLSNNTEVPFFVRLKTQLGVTPVANGDFAISVKADKA